MQYPAKLIATSDMASTPAPLAGGRKITLNTPANVQVREMQLTRFEASTTFDEDFDAVEYIITCDQFPEMQIINSQFTWYSNADVFVSVEMRDSRSVALIAIFTNFWDATFPNALTFHAVVVPMKSPYSQS